ncbi:hypothetical protein CANMA_004984 [Candida margitis]|uniref:uncharacterized protein n=1 Tax=Candida margitis TaxID=1775924 RepID=UPI0022262189|nr:uncharacterized protein CANMA_004984 [Candida margitis]KAI5954145.1 hypothetical protein CANMA_004984 [Candida margitis]
MSDDSEPQQSQVADTSADQSLDATVALQRLIDELNEGDILLMADEIEACIARAKAQREQEINQLTNTNDDLKNEIERKQQQIQALTKINDINAELIENSSSIANYEFSPIDKSQDLLQAIHTKSQELFHLKVDINKERDDLNVALNQLHLKSARLRNELNEINEKLENPEPNKNIDPQKLKDYDLALLKINLYRNLGIRIEPFKKTKPLAELDRGEANVGGLNDDFVEDEPEDVLIVRGGDQAQTLPIELSYSEEYISKFVWENID